MPTPDQNSPRPLHRALRFALRLVGPILFALLLVFVVDARDLVRIVRGADPWSLAGCVLMVQGVIVLRTVRWVWVHEIFDLLPKTFFYHLRLSFATGLASLVLPQAISPLSRFVLLVQDGQPAGKAFGASVVEKLSEFCALAAFGLFGVLYFASALPLSPWLAATAIALAVLAGAIALWWRHGPRAPAAERCGRFVRRKIGAEASRLFDIAVARASRKRMASVAVLSVGIAALQATVTFALATALGIRLPFIYIIAAWGLVALTAMVPISIAGLGTREAVYVATLGAAGVSDDAAFALGLLVVATSLVASLPGAIEWLYRLASADRWATLAAIRARGKLRADSGDS